MAKDIDPIALAHKAQDENDNWECLWYIGLYVNYPKRGVFKKLREIHMDIEFHLTEELLAMRTHYENDMRDWIKSSNNVGTLRVSLAGVFNV